MLNPRLSAAYPARVGKSVTMLARPKNPTEETRVAREKNVSRSEARRRSRVAARAAGAPDIDDDSVVEEDPPAETPGRPSLFKIPNVREDIAAVPDMFRTKRLLWLPFVLLLASFFVALGLPYATLDQSIAQLLFIFVSMVFVPSGLITFLIGGFLAPRASYLVGALLGFENAVLLALFLLVRSDQIPVSATSDQAPVGLAIYVGYALVVGPLAAAFAAWYRNFLNRMGTQGRDRRAARELELAKKRRDEKRAAKRPANSKTSA
jgi:hypothetical protein